MDKKSWTQKSPGIYYRNRLEGNRMTTLTFDKLSFVDKLKAGGFTEEQART